MGPTVAAPETLSYEAARTRVLEAARPLAAEEVPVDEARGRALRRASTAAHGLPPFRNASMDGVAVRSADLARTSAAAPVALAVSGTLAAGGVPGGPLGTGECMWIMTGAMLPAGADAVVAVEEIEPRDGAAAGRVGGWVRIAAPASPGLNVRQAGADVRAGEVVLAEGRELSAYDLALLAALGQACISVGARPRVAVISTGDELLSPGEPLRPAAIRDSNRPMLAALLDECGARVAWNGHVGDDPGEVVGCVERALAIADVVVTMGGVSAGAFDPVKLGIARVGEIALWRVAMKPGRPQAFGTPRGRLFFGLPGNPASVACVFEALVRPALRKLQGFSELDRPRLRARAAHPIESRVGRTDLVRATLERRDGSWWAAEAGAQVSGHLAPQSRAHALLLVPEGTARLEAGDEAEALLLRWPAGA